MRISELPEGERELALLRQQECNNADFSKTTDDLWDAFDWEATIEEHEYWSKWFFIDPVIKIEEKIIAIIETKIATMSSRGFESYYLPIGILKDLIREIKEIK